MDKPPGPSPTFGGSVDAGNQYGWPDEWPIFKPFKPEDDRIPDPHQIWPESGGPIGGGNQWENLK